MRFDPKLWTAVKACAKSMSLTPEQFVDCAVRAVLLAYLERGIWSEVKAQTHVKPEPESSKGLTHNPFKTLTGLGLDKA
jgi:hypothetical protein